MEQNAPNQTIGTGTLEVKPDMQAVHDEMDKIEARLDAIKAKAGTVFEDLLPKLKEAAELMGAMTGGEMSRQGQSVPQADSPEAYEDLTAMQDERMRQEQLDEIRSISQKLDVMILNQTAGE